MAGSSLLAVGLVAVFVALALSLTVLGASSPKRKQVAQSLSAVQNLRAAHHSITEEEAPAFGDRVLAPAWGRLTSLGRRLSPVGMVDGMSKRLDLAGNPAGWNADRFFAYKALGLFAGGLFLLYVGPAGFVPKALATAAGAVAGFLLPDIFVYNYGQKRQLAMKRALPDALDLLTISVEAGLGFDSALAHVARNTTGPLAGELFRVLQEMQIGKGRSEALRALSERTTVADLRSFVASLIQAETFGIPMAQVMRTQAKEMRIKRHQHAEELAQKVPVKMLFPLIFFIMPVLFIIIIGPGILTIITNFSK